VNNFLSKEKVDGRIVEINQRKAKLIKTQFKFFGPLTSLIIMVYALPAAADTSGPYTLEYANLVTGGGAVPFSLPKFDASLGSLQSVDIAIDFSGTVAGTAVGVSQSSSFNGTITHNVFFDFLDLADNVGIVEPTLNLAANIPVGAQSTTTTFGPAFQSTDLSFSVSSGDLRFEAWENGPGNFTGSLDVYFTNTAMNAYGLQFFSGTDSGAYAGSLSITYNYMPIPEPGEFAQMLIGLMLFALARLKHPKTA
jgi:hypothetical protein